MAAILILAVGAAISLYEGYHHHHHPRAMQSPAVNYVVIAMALVFEGVA